MNTSVQNVVKKLLGTVGTYSLQKYLAESKQVSKLLPGNTATKLEYVISDSETIRKPDDS